MCNYDFIVVASQKCLYAERCTRTSELYLRTRPSADTKNLTFTDEVGWDDCSTLACELKSFDIGDCVLFVTNKDFITLAHVHVIHHPAHCI